MPFPLLYAPTLDGLLAKMSAMALDLLADNHPGVEPASRRSSNQRPARSGTGSGLMAPQFDKSLRNFCAPLAVTWSGRAKAVMRFGTAR